MFDFEFVYKDKRIITASAVNKVLYYSFGSDTVVEDKDILTHAFPLSFDLHLYGDGRSYTISHEGLASINVTRSES